MKLIIVRHGETIENKTGITQGQIDGKLSRKGISQAQKVANRLKDKKIDYIYCSDLGRCKETAAEIILFHTETPILFDSLLREINKGIYNGLHKTKYFEAVERFGHDQTTWRPPNGENFNDIKARVILFLDKILNNHHDNQTILIVTHGGWKNALMSHLENISPQESWAKYAFDNTSISILNIDKTGEHDFETINCTKHLILSKRKQ